MDKNLKFGGGFLFIHISTKKKIGRNTDE